MTNNTSRSDSVHWSNEKEVVNGSLPVSFLILLVRILPFPILSLLTLIVSFFYYFSSKRARIDAENYQNHLIAWQKENNKPSLNKSAVFKQIFSFALALVEQVAAWTGKLKYDDIVFVDDDSKELKENVSSGKGAVILFSHLGSMSCLRAFANKQQMGVKRVLPLCILADTKMSAIFNKEIRKQNPLFDMNIVNSEEFDISGFMRFQNTVERGGIVTIAADRTSEKSPDKIVKCSFLGMEAPFPYGSFLLALLLEVPVYYVFSIRSKTFMLHPKYNMFVKKATVLPEYYDLLSRTEKKASVRALCREFVSTMESMVTQYPFQWYNFFDFWGQ